MEHVSTGVARVRSQRSRARVRTWNAGLRFQSGCRCDPIAVLSPHDPVTVRVLPCANSRSCTRWLLYAVSVKSPSRPMSFMDGCTSSPSLSQSPGTVSRTVATAALEKSEERQTSVGSTSSFPRGSSRSFVSSCPAALWAVAVASNAVVPSGRFNELSLAGSWRRKQPRGHGQAGAGGEPSCAERGTRP